MIKAIETSYAGHRFRSRLEARWAVVLDHMRIKWQYEAQGYEVMGRLTLDWDQKINYLPDFWLPDYGMFLEVKGSLTEPDLIRLLNASACLSEDVGDVLIGGPLPQEHAWAAPIRLHMHKGELQASVWQMEDGSTRQPGGLGLHCTLAADYGGSTWDEIKGTDALPVDKAIDLLLSNGHQWKIGGERTPEKLRNAPGWLAAIEAGKQARFEHGQRPRRIR